MTSYYVSLGAEEQTGVWADSMAFNGYGRQMWIVESEKRITSNAQVSYKVKTPCSVKTRL